MLGLLNPRAPVLVVTALCLGAIVVIACAAPLSAQAQAADEQTYRQTTDEAVREFEAGHWEEARALFKRAHEIAPNARTLRGMGMAAFEMRMYTQAIRELDAALRDPRKPLDAELRAHVQQLLDKAREFVGRVKFVPEPQNARLLIDGRPPQLEADGSVLLDVGTHVVSATADAFKPTNMRLSVEGGTDQELRVSLEPLTAAQAVVPAIDADHPPPANTPPPAETKAEQKPAAPRAPDHLDTIGWIAVAGAGAFGVTSAAFWLVGDGQYKDLQKTCSNKCENSQLSSIKTSDLLHKVFLGAAAASGVAAIVLFAIHATRGNNAETHALEPQREGFVLRAGPTGATLEGKF